MVPYLVRDLPCLITTSPPSLESLVVVSGCKRAFRCKLLSLWTWLTIMKKIAAEDQLIVVRLRELLREVDLNTCTERQLRECLEQEFNLSLKDKKDLVRKEIEDFLLLKSAEDEPSPSSKSKKRGKARVLSKELQEFMGSSQAKWPEIVGTVWKYIRENNLQNEEDRRKIRVDETLGKIFQEPLDLSSVGAQLSRHLQEDESSLRPAQKRAKKEVRGRKSGKGKQGFMRPLRLTKEMRDVLCIPDGEEVARGDLSKKFWAYFRSHDLQDPKDRRWILCDDNLKSLLKTDRFQAFSIQKLVKPHILGYLDEVEADDGGDGNAQNGQGTPSAQKDNEEVVLEETNLFNTPADVVPAVENNQANNDDNTQKMEATQFATDNPETPAQQEESQPQQGGDNAQDDQQQLEEEQVQQIEEPQQVQEEKQQVQQMEDNKATGMLNNQEVDEAAQQLLNNDLGQGAEPDDIYHELLGDIGEVNNNEGG
eukprot:TRINITY_DN3572_c0_g1_i1.p1 TRINITY_DN3572_c0_g1~~TRINITY_DN3572_c0_g1_i1.p1  ORF type:complete len:480 (+),score=80.56 TRINITY_DN3572_c0_g1_i1:2-1441(+)